MSTATLTRAWTDLEFRAGLSTEELELLDHPSGDLEAEIGELHIQEATAASTACTKWSGGTLCCC